LSETFFQATKPHHYSVKPIDQMRSEYGYKGLAGNRQPVVERAHDLFSRRMAFENFNIPSFETLLDALEKAHKIAPFDDQILYELAHVLTQFKPNIVTLQRAQTLLERIAAPSDENFRFRMKRLQGAINVMIREYTTGTLSPPRKAPHRVNWAVYNRCPMVCVGCYNTFSPYQLNLDECKETVLKLKDAGVGFITLSGGDPLLWPDLWLMIEYILGQNMQIGIDTTGYTLTESQLKLLKDHIRYLGLPIDGSNEQGQAIFRKAPSSVFENFQRVLTLCEKYQVRTKINTVIHQRNFQQLEAIGDFLQSYNCVQDWSVFQWWPLRTTPSMFQKMAIDLDFFNTITAGLQKKYTNFRVRVRSVQARSFTHIFIQNSGTITTFGSYYQEEIILGHILHDRIDRVLRSPAIRWDSPKFEEIDRFTGE
jgi:MoaA/NifB/PqqE/SkfB family radical SAM enzyme